MVRKPKGEPWRPGMRKGMRYEDIKANKLRQESEIVDRMLENIMKDIEEGKVKKEDIKDIANIIAEKKLQAPTPEKFEKYEKQERFMRDLYEGIPPKEEDKRFFVNTFESYWKVLQDYRKKGKVPADYSVFPAHIAEAIKRGQITTKDIEIVGTPSGFEYKVKKPIELPSPEERKLPLKPDVLVFGEEAKEEEKPKEEPKPALPKPEEDKHYAVKVGKNKFLVKGFREYIVKARKVDDKWIAEADDLYGSVFPYEGMEEEKAKGKSLEEVLDKISDRIDFRGAFPIEEEEKPEILEQRIKEIKDEVLKKPKEKPSVSVAKVVGSDVLEFEEEKKETKPKKATKKESKAGVEVLEFKAAEEKIDTGKAAEAVSEAVKQVSEKAKEMVAKTETVKPETKKPEGKREKKLRAKEEEVVDRIIEEWSESKTLRPLTEDFLIRNLPKVAEKRPEVAQEILSKMLKKEEPKSEFLEAFKTVAEKKPEAAVELVKEWQKSKIQEAREEIRNRISLGITTTRKGLEIEGVLPERYVVVARGKEATAMPTSLYLDLEEQKIKKQEEQLERKRKEQEEMLKKLQEEQMLREEAQRRELEEFYRSRGMRPSAVLNEAETLAEPVKTVMETPQNAEPPAVAQREIPSPNFIERFASGVKPVVEKAKPAVRNLVSGVKSAVGIKPADVARTEVVSAVERIDNVPYQVEVKSVKEKGKERLITTRKNMLTGKVEIEDVTVPRSATEILKQSVPARFIKAVIPMGTPQMRRWLHAQAGAVRPISRELDWRKVEMRRLRLASRR